METKKEITIGNRLASMLVDHFIMSFAMSIPIIPFMVIGMRDVFNISHEQTSTEPSLIIYGFILGFAIYFNKDFFNGRSPAKRILKTQIINNKTNEVASPLRCLIRNLTIPIWPLEIIFVLINPTRRLGDYIAGTRIELADIERSEGKRKFKEYIFPLIIGIGFTYLITLPFVMLSDSFNEAEINYDKDSYNNDKSLELSYFLSFHLKDYCDSTSIKMYDKIENDSLKYISLLFYVNNEYLLINSSEFEDLKTKIIDTLNLKISSNSFVLIGKIIYQVPGHIQIKYINFDLREPKEYDYVDNRNYINDSTKVIKVFYDSGQLESEATYVYGKLYGTYKEWFENGNIKSEINFENGKRNGVTSTWFSNGVKESEMLYNNNLFVRYLKKWDENGNKIVVKTE